MINNVKEILASYMAKGTKKGEDAKEGADGFEALLAMLMNQGMNIQTGDIPELQAGLAEQMQSMAGISGNTNVTDMFGINPAVLKLLTGTNAEDQDTGANSSSAGFEALLKGLAQSETNVSTNLSEEALKIMGINIPDTLNAEAKTGSSNADTSTKAAEQKVQAPNTNADMPKAYAAQEQSSDTALKMQADDSAAQVKVDNQNTVEAKTEQSAKNSDSQFIVARPEVLKILKGEGAKTAPGSSKEISLNAVDKKDETGAAKSDEIKAVDTTDKKPGEESSVKQEGNHSSMHFAMETKEAQPAKVQSSQVDVKQYVSANKEDILNQIYDKVKVVNSQGLSELHINLKPQALGEVSIKIIMENGMMTGRIMVENGHVKDLIESSMSQIKDNLKNQNIDVSNLSVGVSSGQSNMQDNQKFSFNNRWAFNQKTYSRGNNIEHVEEIQPIQRNIQQRGLLNMLA